MKKILFPTDFSETANNAFLYALNLAKNQNAELYAIHAFIYPMMSGGIDSAILEKVYSTIELGNFENFKDHIPSLKKIAVDNDFEDINIKFILKEGKLSYILQSFIEQEKIDFVVMGTTGNSGVDKFLFGSNTMTTIKNLKIPVLSIPNGYEYKNIKNIGFTTLFEEKDRIALNYLLNIAIIYNAKVHCLNISKEENYDTLILNRWENYYKDDPVSFSVYTSEDEMDAVMKFAKNENIDLLTIVRHNKTFFEKIFSPSFTKKVFSENIVPLLVIHE